MLARLRTSLQNDRIGVSRSAAGVPDPRCNVVHIERAAGARLREAARRAADEWARALGGADEDGEGTPSQRRRQRRGRASAVLRVGRAREDARGRLIPQWMARTYPELAEAIAADAGELAAMVHAATAAAAAGAAAKDAAAKDATPVAARLEVLSTQPCPKWHADTVGARALVTYAGPGTQYLPNSRVRRGWDRSGAPVVAGIRSGGLGEGGGRVVDVFDQAAPWDVLLLKGHACPGMMGMGAVHRSPPMEGEDDDEEGCAVEEEEGDDDDEAAWRRHDGGGLPPHPPRLVLTVDDAVPCDCCPPPSVSRLDESSSKAVR